MSKVTKKERIKELERQVRGLTVLFSSLNTWSEYADSMLTELNHALPDPEYDAKCEAQEADVDASLDRHRERLGLNKPRLKQLDQSVFDGLDEKWRFAAVDRSDECWIYTGNPVRDGIYWSVTEHIGSSIGTGYDASNWQNSLIEREKAELTGSDLCRAMLARGDKWVLCLVANNPKNIDLDQEPDVVISHDENGFYIRDSYYNCALPISIKGELLTASEVGL